MYKNIVFKVFLFVFLSRNRATSRHRLTFFHCFRCWKGRRKWRMANANLLRTVMLLAERKHMKHCYSHHQYAILESNDAFSKRYSASNIFIIAKILILELAENMTENIYNVTFYLDFCNFCNYYGTYYKKK